jgi:tetratricopeptide (TPR) repeat protein
MVLGRFQKLEVHSQPAPFAPPVQAPEPADADYWLNQADQARRRGRFEQALRDYSRAVEANRANRAGWLGQARMLIALEEYPEAELWASKAAELFRADADLTAAQAQAIARLGETKKAQAAADTAIRQPGQSAYRWLVRGELLLISRLPLAGRCFHKMIELHDDWLTRIEIAEVCLHHRRPATALDHAQRAVQSDPTEPHGWLLMADCQRGLGLIGPAHHALTICLELDPANPRARAAMDSLSRIAWPRRLWSLWS